MNQVSFSLFNYIPFHNPNLLTESPPSLLKVQTTASTHYSHLHTINCIYHVRDTLLLLRHSSLVDTSPRHQLRRQ